MHCISVRNGHFIWKFQLTELLFCYAFLVLTKLHLLVKAIVYFQLTNIYLFRVFHILVFWYIIS